MRLFSLLFLSLFPYFITCQEPLSLIGGDYSLVNSGTAAWSIQNITHFGDNPDIGVRPGGIVTFRLQQSSQHPFGFSTVKGDKNQPSVTTKNYQIEADGGCRFYALSAGTPTAAYLPVDTTGATPCILKWTVPASFKTGDLFYQCHGHPAMTGAFFVQAASTDNSTSGTTTATTSTTATPTTATPTTTPNPTTTTPPTNPTTTTPPTNPTTTTPPTNSSTTSPPTNSGNVTNPTNTTSSSSSSTGIVGSSSTAVGGAASHLLPSFGIMFLIAAVMATIPL